MRTKLKNRRVYSDRVGCTDGTYAFRLTFHRLADKDDPHPVRVSKKPAPGGKSIDTTQILLSDEAMQAVANMFLMRLPIGDVQDYFTHLSEQMRHMREDPLHETDTREEAAPDAKI